MNPRPSHRPDKAPERADRHVRQVHDELIELLAEVLVADLEQFPHLAATNVIAPLGDEPADDDGAQRPGGLGDNGGRADRAVPLASTPAGHWRAP